MTDFAAAAAALEVPEALVRRSAEARAKADNVSVDELVAAWAGGGTAPARAPAPPASPSTADSPVSTEEESTPSPAPAAPAPTVAPPPAPTPTPTPAPLRGGVPPILVGAAQGINNLIGGAVGLLLLSILIGFLIPSLPEEGTGVRSSNHGFSSAALAGREIYLEEGCGSCHTQMVRAVVADANLGPVSLSDINQVIGYRRIGPDLAAIGSRIESTDSIVALLSGQTRHPAVTGLSDDSLADLLAFLREST